MSAPKGEIGKPASQKAPRQRRIRRERSALGFGVFRGLVYERHDRVGLRGLHRVAARHLDHFRANPLRDELLWGGGSAVARGKAHAEVGDQGQMQRSIRSQYLD